MSIILLFDQTHIACMTQTKTNWSKLSSSKRLQPPKFFYSSLIPPLTTSDNYNSELKWIATERTEVDQTPLTRPPFFVFIPDFTARSFFDEADLNRYNVKYFRISNYRKSGWINAKKKGKKNEQKEYIMQKQREA